MNKFLFAVFLALYMLPAFQALSMAQTMVAEDTLNPVKTEHADPVFEDLTTDLGARKGENQLNMNLGYRELEVGHHILLTQLEYEFAPADALGFEVLIPYTVYFNNELSEVDRPGNRLEFLQWGSQYTFFTSPEKKISLAAGFRNAFEAQEPDESNNRFKIENIRYFPFLVAAKNWEDKFFLLFSGGTEIDHALGEGADVEHQLNTAFHYGFSDEDHYVGVEFNKSLEDGDFEMIIRPQIILQVMEDYNIGATFGIPVGAPDLQWTAFLRLAYEFQ